jgi:coiled-coil domain-containing protein 22
MQNLQTQWEVHKKPLEEEREQLKQQMIEKRALMQQKMEETKTIRVQIDELNSELTSKEELIKDLNKDLEKIAKESNSNTSNRQFYTKRILEIVANIDKQKKEIDKVIYL